MYPTTASSILALPVSWQLMVSDDGQKSIKATTEHRPIQGHKERGETKRLFLFCITVYRAVGISLVIYVFMTLTGVTSVHKLKFADHNLSLN